jgi:hypothetical protein
LVCYSTTGSRVEGGGVRLFMHVHGELHRRSALTEWEQIAPEFDPDGGLRDIYVLEASLRDWQVVLDAIRGFQPHPIYAVDGLPEDLPTRVEHIFHRRSDASPMMSFLLLDMTLNCHFFGSDQAENDLQKIEFDLNPREVTSSEHLGSLIDFMKLLGNLTNKAVILTPENCIENPILEYDPQSRDVVWNPASAV